MMAWSQSTNLSLFKKANFRSRATKKQNNCGLKANSYDHQTAARNSDIWWRS